MDLSVSTTNTNPNPRNIQDARSSPAKTVGAKGKRLRQKPHFIHKSLSSLIPLTSISAVLFVYCCDANDMPCLSPVRLTRKLQTERPSGENHLVNSEHNASAAQTAWPFDGVAMFWVSQSYKSRLISTKEWEAHHTSCLFLKRSILIVT
jgi:hypothetical protein